MTPTSRRRLIELLRNLNPAQKANYYRICGVADHRLRQDGHGSLNIQQCEMICERLKLNREITMTDIKRLSSGRIAPRPMPSEPEPEPNLFDLPEGGSSSSSDPTST